MKKFVLLYIGILLGLALLYPLVRWSMGEKKAVRIYPSLAAVIPADTQFALGFQIERLKPTPLYKRLVEGRRVAAIEAFAARTGFDPRKSIYEIVLASNGEETIAFAVGKFTRTTELRQGMEPPIKIEGDRTVRSTYKGYTLEGHENASLCFLNASTVMAGPAAALRRMIDRQQQNPLPPAELLKAIEAVPLENQLWGVAVGDINRLVSRFSGLKGIPLRVSRATFEADASLGFRAKLALECPDAKSAEQLAVGIRTAAALLPTGKELATALEQIDVRQDQSTVNLRLNVSADLVESLLALLPPE